MLSVNCREQFASGESVLAHDDDGHVRHGSCQPCRTHLPQASPASLRHAQLGGGGQVCRLLRQGLVLTHTAIE